MEALTVISEIIGFVRPVKNNSPVIESTLTYEPMLGSWETISYRSILPPSIVGKVLLLPSGLDKI